MNGYKIGRNESWTLRMALKWKLFQLKKNSPADDGLFFFNLDNPLITGVTLQQIKYVKFKRLWKKKFQSPYLGASVATVHSSNPHDDCMKSVNFANLRNEIKIRLHLSEFHSKKSLKIKGFPHFANLSRKINVFRNCRRFAFL